MNKLNLPLFIYAQYKTDTGEIKIVHIQTKGIGENKQDCKIGDFAENWWIRPKKAVLGIEYKTIGDYKKAIKLSMKKMLNYQVIKIYQVIDVDNQEYEQEI